MWGWADRTQDGGALRSAATVHLCPGERELQLVSALHLCQTTGTVDEVETWTSNSFNSRIRIIVPALSSPAGAT